MTDRPDIADLEDVLRTLASQHGGRAVADTAVRLAAAEDMWARQDSPADVVATTVHDTVQRILGRPLRGPDATRLAAAVRATAGLLLEDQRNLVGLEQFLARLEHGALLGQRWALPPSSNIGPAQWHQILHHARLLVEQYRTGYADKKVELRTPSADDIVAAPELVAALRALGTEYGPYGVARVAAALCQHRLVEADHPDWRNETSSICPTERATVADIAAVLSIAGIGPTVARQIARRLQHQFEVRQRPTVTGDEP